MHKSRKPRSLFANPRLAFGAWILCLCLAASGTAPAPLAQEQPPQPQFAQILDYISKSWDALTRSTDWCLALADRKIVGPQTIYVPHGLQLSSSMQSLPQSCSVKIEELPVEIHALGEHQIQNINPPGLLYLPNPYVVPGGRFNEMYGWDSYFIIRGLLLDGKIDLAKGIVRNFFFEIKNYGGVLNANRTYYLTRSQPPFLTSMILAIYDAEKSAGADDLAWLRESFPYAARDADFWQSQAHFAGNPNLARYFDFGEGPVPEMADSPGYYRGAVDYFAHHPRDASGELVQARSSQAFGPLFLVSPCLLPPGLRASGHSDCAATERVALTEDFYKGDRSMRESGFDTTFRFGPYGDATHHFAAVDLNSLLYKTEMDLAQMAALIGADANPGDWRAQADERAAAVNRYCWNPKAGLFFDYDFTAKKQSSYEFASTFYPLWAGLASKEQAAAIEMHLSDFEKPGGLQTSAQITGAQWDAPYGWAPIQLIAAEGLRRYGYNADADRISREFLADVLENFQREGTIREKYDVVHRTTDTNIQAGYTQNVVGFGWTNGVFLALLHDLQSEKGFSSQQPH